MKCFRRECIPWRELCCSVSLSEFRDESVQIQSLSGKLRMQTWLCVFESLASMKIKDAVVFREMSGMGLEGTSAADLIESWHRAMKQYIVI